ncbi:MAG: sensor histidine kinase [Pseudomonadota bacterium]
MMLPARSLRLRLLAGTLVWIIATLAIAGWGLSGLFRQHVTEQLHSRLELQLEQLSAMLAVDAQGKTTLSGEPGDPNLHRPYSGHYWQIDAVSDDGSALRRGLLRSRSLWDSVLEVPEDAPADGRLHRHHIPGPQDDTLMMVERLIYPADTPEQGLRLIVATDARLVQEPVERFTGLLSIALVILGIGLVVAAVMQVVIGLRPLSHLRQALQALRSGEAEKISGNYPQEVQPLVDDFNAVLEHNARIIQQARTRAGNLAHALKTPLTILANAAARPDDKLPRLVNQQVALARRQVDHHLARARAAAAANVPGVRCEVRPLLDTLLRVMQRLHPDKHISTEVSTHGAAPLFRGDEQDLQEMLGNLLENAWKWTTSRVDIALTSEDGQFTLTIDDDGPGLSPEQRQEVMERGVRADEQVPGSGLGLAIVNDLAQLYSGGLRLDNSPLGGLRVSLTLPTAGEH